MARAKGFQGIVGWAPGTTWGTAVAAAALRGIEVKDLSVVGNRALIPDAQMTGRATARASRKGDLKVEGSLMTDLRYEGLEPLIANVLGTAGAPTTSDTSGKKHVFVLKDDLDGVFGTLAYELLKDTTVVEIPSAKIVGLTIKCAAGQSPEVEFRFVGNDYKTDSAVNTTTTIDTVTYPANREFAAFAQSVLRMNAASGGALAGSDAIFISSWEISIDRGLEGAVTTQFGDKIGEPRPTGPTKITGTIEFADLQDGTGGNLAFIADQLAATPKKLDLTITSPTLCGSATQYYQHVLYLPCVQFGDGKPAINSWGALTWSAPFEAFHAPAVPTGFPATYDEAITWEVYSQRATDALA